MHPLAVAALAVAAFLAGRRVGSRAPSALSDSRRHFTPGAGPAARGKIVPCAGADGNATPIAAGARHDEQSDPAFPWCYAFAEGDSLGAVAESITGDEGRYAEIVLVNPELPRVGVPGHYMGADEWGVSPEALHAGVTARLPPSFHKWISEGGDPSGDYLPWAPGDAVRSPATAMDGTRYAPLGLPGGGGDDGAGHAAPTVEPKAAPGPAAASAGRDGGERVDPRQDWRMGGDVFRGVGLDVFGGPEDGRPIVMTNSEAA